MADRNETTTSAAAADRAAIAHVLKNWVGHYRAGVVGDDECSMVIADNEIARCVRENLDVIIDALDLPPTQQAQGDDARVKALREATIREFVAGCDCQSDRDAILALLDQPTPAEASGSIPQDSAWQPNEAHDAECG